MNTKEFIRRIHEADPSGEAIVQLDDGSPYYFILKPSYYDGSIGELILDSNDKIVGFANKRHCKENKLVISGLNQESYIEHVIEEDMNAIPNITFDDNTRLEEDQPKIKKIISRERKFYYDIAIKHLTEFCCQKLYKCSIKEISQTYSGSIVIYDIDDFVIDNYEKLTTGQVIPNRSSWMDIYTKFWNETLDVECIDNPYSLPRKYKIRLKWKDNV